MGKKNDQEEQLIRDRLALERKKEEPEKAILVGVGLKGENSDDYLESLSELYELAETAGAKVLGSTSQLLEKLKSATLIGKGKAAEIAQLVQETNANLVIVDHQLTGSQVANLEKIFLVPVIDRTQLILDIFAQRAQTHEGKLQVELAQHLDQLPRMVGAWMGSLSRLGGGIGTRGPGETALEMDRRRINEKIDNIRKKLRVVQKRRAQHRDLRSRQQIPSFALIGYTNAGKSSLLNRLTSSSIYAKDQLFATLDPTTRKLYLPEGPEAVITDTVGFIRRLPTKLIEAFKATLEESEHADILVHVIDISSPQRNQQMKVVNDLVYELGWQHKPMIFVYNKVDQATEKQKFQIDAFPRVLVSATTGEGIDKLRSLMIEGIQSLQREYELFIPLEEQEKLFLLAREAKIESQEIGSRGTLCKVRLSNKQLHKWRSYLV